MSASAGEVAQIAATVHPSASMERTHETQLGRKIRRVEAERKAARASQASQGSEITPIPESTESSQSTSTTPRRKETFYPREPETKVYRKRWLILFLFVLYSMSNSMQWIQYSIIANVITKYYDVSVELVNWTSMVFMVAYIPLIFPATWILNRKGLRYACMIGSAGTCIGAWLKVASVGPNRFLITFIGQTIVACSQAFVLSIPARLAAVWFGSNEVSSACAIGVFGNQLGVAFGFVFPPMIVKDHDEIEMITRDLRFMFYSVAVFSSFVFIFNVAAFRSTPPLPPSRAQVAQRAAERTYLNSLLMVSTNWGFMLLLVSYGIMTGVFYAISTLLNQVLLLYFPNSEEDAGRIGLVIIISGMLGSVFCGITLDKTKRYKSLTVMVYVFALLSLIVYMFTLDWGFMWLVYFSSGFLGFFMTGYLPVGFEFGAELTFPEPEGTSSGMLNVSAQVFGIVFTYLYGSVFTQHGDLAANTVLGVALVVGTICALFIPEDLKRQRARPTGIRNLKP